MHVRHLAQIDRREVEAEHVDRPRQRGQPRIGQRLAVVRREGIDDDLEIGAQFLRARVGGGRADRVAAGILAGQLAAGGRQARIHADQRAPVRLIRAVLGVIRRAFGQGQQVGAHVDEQGGHRQLRAQRVDLVEVPREDHAGLPLRGMAQRLRGDERVAVAVAADPRAHLEEGGQRGRLAARAPARKHRGDILFQLAVQRGNLAQEGGLVVRQRVLDLVGHHQARGAQHARLPQLGDVGAQQGDVALALAHGQRRIALGQQAGDLALRVENALALHFGRVGRQHRHDQRGVEEAPQRIAREALVGRRQQRAQQAARLRRRAGQRVHAAAAVMVLVFGDVGQVREVAEGAHHRGGLVARQRLE